MGIDVLECLLCGAVHVEWFVGNPNHSWECKRCGQQWNAARVAEVVKYRLCLKAETEAIEHGAVS